MKPCAECTSLCAFSLRSRFAAAIRRQRHWMVRVPNSLCVSKTRSLCFHRRSCCPSESRSTTGVPQCINATSSHTHRAGTPIFYCSFFPGSRVGPWLWRNACRDRPQYRVSNTSKPMSSSHALHFSYIHWWNLCWTVSMILLRSIPVDA